MPPTGQLRIQLRPRHDLVLSCCLYAPTYAYALVVCFVDPFSAVISSLAYLGGEQTYSADTYLKAFLYSYVSLRFDVIKVLVCPKSNFFKFDRI
jgi:hypothetical protein